MITAFSVNMICSGASIAPRLRSPALSAPFGAEQRHPAGGPHGVADEQRQHHQHHQDVLVAALAAGQHVSQGNASTRQTIVHTSATAQRRQKILV
jgi:hypothetical protein